MLGHSVPEIYFESFECFVKLSGQTNCILVLVDVGAIVGPEVAIAMVVVELGLLAQVPRPLE